MKKKYVILCGCIAILVLISMVMLLGNGKKSYSLEKIKTAIEDATYIKVNYQKENEEEILKGYINNIEDVDKIVEILKGASSFTSKDKMSSDNDMVIYLLNDNSRLLAKVDLSTPITISKEKSKYNLKLTENSTKEIVNIINSSILDSNSLEVGTAQKEYKLIYDGDRQVYTNFNNITYKDVSLAEAFSNKVLSISNFIGGLNYVDEMNDGGSRLYEAADRQNKKFFVVNCYTLDGDTDVYIGKDESVSDMCNKNIKVDNDCLESTLGGYINGGNVEDINIYDITKNRVDYTLNKVNNIGQMYSIVKTNNSKVLEDFDKYYEQYKDEVVYDNMGDYHFYLYLNGHKPLIRENILKCFK